MRKTRVIYSDNATLNDWTVDLENYHAGTKTFSLVAAEDYIMIGNVAPFNHFYVKMGTASVASSTMTLEYWGGSSWQSVAELIDETSGLTSSGFVTFVPDRNNSWTRQDTDDGVTGLTTLKIYDKYWIRLSFSNDLTASSVIDWIGQKFSDDNYLKEKFPDLNRSSVLTQWESGKTDWEEQHVSAASEIVKDLIAKDVIFSKNQILEKDSFRLASVYKTAEIIYSGFGPSYEDDRIKAMNKYLKAMDKSIYDVDLNSDADLSLGEMGARQGFLSR